MKLNAEIIAQNLQKAMDVQIIGPPPPETFTEAYLLSRKGYRTGIGFCLPDGTC
jgi:hypothetical protein